MDIKGYTHQPLFALEDTFILEGIECCVWAVYLYTDPLGNGTYAYRVSPVDYRHAWEQRFYYVGERGRLIPAPMVGSPFPFGRQITPGEAQDFYSASLAAHPPLRTGRRSFREWWEDTFGF